MQDGTDITRRPRGRPRRFDPATVAVRLIETFWTHGYAATSLDQLAAAAGMNRPSLYAAFGDKKAMYRNALKLFAENMRAEVRTVLAAPVLADALRQFYATAIGLYLSGEQGPRGCLFVCTGTVEALPHADIRDDVGAVLHEIDAALGARIAHAQATGEVAAGTDPQALGRLAGAVLHSLAVRARIGDGEAELSALADTAVALICQGHHGDGADRSGGS